jgi:hypothetical protein
MRSNGEDAGRMKLKFIRASVCVAIIATSYLVLPAEARRKNDYRYDEDRYSAQPGWAGKQQRSAQPLSLDGRNTGRTRTCGSDVLQYDGYGVPFGPYCH